MIGVELNQTGQEGNKGVIQSIQISSGCSLCRTILFREQMLHSEYLLGLIILKELSIMLSYKLHAPLIAIKQQ